MAEELGSATLTLDANQGPLNQALDLMDTATQGRVTALGDKIKGIFGTKLGAGMALGAAAIVGGVAIAGAALYKLGQDFDNAYDILQTRTGQSGQQLDSLKDSFKNVVSSVPTDFESAANAVAGINQRLGLTGPELEDVSRKVLELSRLTGTDLETNIASLTRLFGDWGISADQMGPHMDKLYRLSQRTGIGVSDLAELMVQFGSPLRQLGMDFDTAAVMFAKFEKEGVNIQTLMPGMRFALKNFSDPSADLVATAKELGISLDDPAVSLQGFMKAIQAAPSDLAANQLAFEIFGQRSGPDMAAAMREGRFEFDELMNAMNNGKNTIEGDAAATNDLSENWTIFKNKVLVGLEPVATAVFNGINQALVGLMAAMTHLSQNWTQIWSDIRAAITPLIPLFQWFVNTAKMQLQGFVTYVSGVFNVVRGIIMVFSGLFQGDFSKMWDGIKLIFQGALNMVVGIVMMATAPIRAAAQMIADAIWDPIKTVASIPISMAIWLANIAQKLVDFVASFSAKAAALGKAIVSGIVDFVKGIPGTVSNWIQQGVNTIANFVTTAYNKAISVGKSIVDGIKNGIDAVASAIETAIKAPINAAIQAINGIKIRIQINWDNPVPGAPGIHIDTEIDPFPHIPYLATGARFFHGGLAALGERGMELANLPRGTRVYGAGATDRMMGADSEAINRLTGVLEELLDSGTMGVVDALVDVISEKQGYDRFGRRRRTTGTGRMTWP